MMKRPHILLLLMSLFSLNILAQETTMTDGYTQSCDTIIRQYALDEEWYIQGQLGYSYLAAENTRYVDFSKIAKPEFSFALGKRFSPVWGARIQGQWGGDTGAFYGHDSKTPVFDFSHLSFNVIGSFNISEFANRKQREGYNRRWNLSALLGFGVAFTNFDETVDLSTEKFLNKENRSYFSPFAGVELAYSIDPHWDVMAELGSHWMGKCYNGMIIERKFWLKKIDQSIPLMLGVRYTFNKPRRKFKPDAIIYEATRQEPVILPMQPVESQPYKEYGTRQQGDQDCYTMEELVDMAKDRKDIRGKNLCCGENVTFDYSQALLKIYATFYLDKVVELMQMQPVNLLIKGLGGRHSNINLTDRRMRVIRDYLVEHGVDANRLVYQYVPIGTPCVDYTSIRLELMEYPEMPMEDCLEIDELLEKAAMGKSIRENSICGIDMVHFDTDKAIIKPEFAKYLDKIALLMTFTDINILIMGHTDNQGSVDYNYELSERRSKAVLKYLNSKGVAYNRMKFSYHSELIPYSDNKTERGRSVNRRCEFMILP